MGVVSASIALLGRIRKPIFFTIDLYYGILLRTQFSIETWVQGDVRPAPQASPEEVQGLGFRVQGSGFRVWGRVFAASALSTAPCTGWGQRMSCNASPPIQISILERV